MDKQHATEQFVEKCTQRWTRLAKSCKVVPLLGEVRQADAVSQAYHCRLTGAIKVPLPKHLSEKAHSKDFRVQVRVSATLFHVRTFTFFGSTFHGPELDFHKHSKETNAGLYDFNFGEEYGFLFHTAVDLEEVKLVCEIVVTVSEARSEGIRGEEYTVCWAPADASPKRDAEKFSVARNEKDVAHHQLYGGTPRLLLFVGGGQGVTVAQLPGALSKAKISNGMLNAVVMTHTKMQDTAIAMLAENELVGGTDPVLSAAPGVIGHMLGSGGGFIRLTKKCPIVLEELKVIFADRMEERLQRFIFHRSNKRVEIKGFQAEVGVHNGRKFVGPVRHLELARTGDELFSDEVVVLPDYVANDMYAPAGLCDGFLTKVHDVGVRSGVAVVWLLFAAVEMDGVSSRISVGWLPIVATQSHGDKGPILVGEYAVPLKSTNPMMSVSNAIVYSDREAAGAGPKERKYDVRLTVVVKKLEKDSKGVKADPGVKTVTLKSRVDAAAASGEFAVPDSEGEGQSEKTATGTATSGRESTSKRSSRRKEGAGVVEEGTSKASTGKEDDEGEDEDEDEDEDKDDQPRITLLCNLEDLGKDEVEEVQGDFLNMKFQEFIEMLEDKFDRDLDAFEYTPLAGGEPVEVDEDEEFDLFLDMIEDDLASDKAVFAGRVPIVLIPAENDDDDAPGAGKGETEAKKEAPKTDVVGGDSPAERPNPAVGGVAEAKGDAGVQGKKQGAEAPKPSGRRESTASSRAGGRRTSTEGDADESVDIKLSCQRQQIDGVRGTFMLILKDDASWDDVRRMLKKEFNVECLLEYVNVDGNTQRVHDEDTWDDLVEEILEDLEGDNEMDGECIVDLIPADPAFMPPQRAPSGGSAAASDKPLSRKQSGASLGPTKPGSRRASEITGGGGSRRDSQDVPETVIAVPKQEADVRRDSGVGRVPKKPPTAPSGRESGTRASGGKPPRRPAKGSREGDENRHPQSARRSAESKVPKLPRTTAAGSQALSTDGSDMESARETPGRRVVRRRRAHPGAWGHAAMDEEFEYVDDDEEVLHSMYRGSGFDSRAPLSRALKAQLFTTTIRDLVPTYEKDVPLVEVPLPVSAIDLGKEAADRLQRHTIILHIVAVALPPNFKAVHFSTRFYHFEPLKTAMANMMPPLVEEGAETTAGAPCMLKVEGAGETGVTITFTVDALEHGRGSDTVQSLHFARYLAASTLLVDVWDSDTALPIGSMQLELRQLLRQGREAVQTAGDYPILDTSLSPPHPSGALRLSSELYAHADAKPIGRAFVRFVNVGDHSPAEAAWQQMRMSADGNPDEQDDGVRHSRSASPSKAAGRVVPLVDATFGARNSWDGKPLASSKGPERGLALLAANKAAVARAVRSAGASADALTVDTLQKCLVGLRLELTARQVTAACTHLADLCGGDGFIDLSKVSMRGDAIIRGSEESEPAKDVMADHALLLLGAITTRFGSAQAAADKFGAAKGVVDLEAMKGMAEALSDVTAAPMSEAEVRALLGVMSEGVGGGKGVSLSKFQDFFSVSVQGAASKPVGGEPARASGGREGGAPGDRKLERWERLKARRGQERGAATAEKQMLIDAARVMRDVHKPYKIQEFLESSITTTVHVYPAFAELCYVQYTLRNPYSEDRVISVRFEDDQLELVTDASEWRTLNQVFGIDGLVEEDMMAKDSKGCTVWMQGHQQISLPFKYRTTSAGMSLRSNHPGGAQTKPMHEGNADEEPDKGRVICVQMLSGKHNGNLLPMYILNINVNPRPYVVDQVFRFRQGAHDILKKRILVDLASAMYPHEGWRQGGVAPGPIGKPREGPKHVWCSDSNAIVGTSNHLGEGRMQEVHLKFRCGEAGSVHTFYVVLYNDAAHASVFEVWQIHVYAMNRLDLQGLVGQTERQGCSITVRAASGPRSVHVVTSHPADLAPDGTDRFELGDNLTEIPFKYQPMVAGRREVLVNFMDAAKPARGATPLASWLVTARANPPLIAKRYDITLPPGKPASKKILYTNPFSSGRVFRLKTNRPELLSFRETTGQMAIAGKGSMYMGLKFAPRKAPGNEEILIFVNDEEDKNLECLCVGISYA